MRDDLPSGHRVLRLTVLAVLVAAAVAAGTADPVTAATGSVVQRGVRLTRVVWEPLFTGDGWVRPLLPGPGGSPAPQPSPSGLPQPAKPAPSK